MHFKHLDRRYYWLALGLVPNLSLPWRRRLLQAFSEPKEIFVWANGNNADPAFSETDEPFVETRASFAKAKECLRLLSCLRVEQELKNIERFKASLLTFADSDFPAVFRELYDPPPFIIIKGDRRQVVLSDAKRLSVVGTRQCSAYGQMVTHGLVTPLAKMGYIIVSGGARGIDAVAHRSALAVGGRTIAILGSGIASPYPSQHRSLFEEISQSGAVISEFGCTTAARSYHFPQRNRLIAALSESVLVTEAGLKSGSLITARLALDLGREIMAVCGPIHEENFRGCNRLLQDGAHLVTDHKDVFEIMGDRAPSEKSANPLNGVQKTLLRRMGSAPITREEAFQRAGMGLGEFAKEWNALERSDCVYPLGGDRMIRSLRGSEETWQKP